MLEREDSCLKGSLYTGWTDKKGGLWESLGKIRKVEYLMEMTVKWAKQLIYKGRGGAELFS